MSRLNHGVAMALGVGILVVAGLPAAALDTPLFRPVGVTIEVEGTDPVDPGLVRHRTVALEPAVFEARIAQPMRRSESLLPSTVTLNLFDDVTMSVRLTDASVDEIKGADIPLSGLLTGSIPGADFAIVTLFVEGETLMGTIWKDGMLYRIMPNSPPLHRVEEVDSTLLPQEHGTFAD